MPNTISNSDIALIYASYTPYDPLLHMTHMPQTTNFTLASLDEYADTHTLLTQFNYHISRATFSDDTLTHIKQAQYLTQHFDIRNLGDPSQNFIPDTINKKNALFVNKSDVWTKTGATYIGCLFGTRNDLSLDAISCTMIRFSTQRTSWAKLCSLGIDGALFGVSQFSGQVKMVIQFDTSSYCGAGDFIDISFSQNASPLSNLAFGSVEQLTCDTFDINFQLEL